MPAASTFSDAEWAQQLATERARREQAEAELAQMRARLAALEPPAPFRPCMPIWARWCITYAWAWCWWMAAARFST